MKGLFKLVVLGALAVGVMKLIEAKRQFMTGTEDELRSKVRDKFADHIPPDKIGEVEDKVVEFARARGTLVDAVDLSPNGEGSGRTRD